MPVATARVVVAASTASASGSWPREPPIQAAPQPGRSSTRQLAPRPEWSISGGPFDLPVSRATSSHHFAVLGEAGLLEQREDGTRRFNRLRRPEFDARFPGLLDLVLQGG